MTQNPFFPEIRGNFGFGCMRLPLRDGLVDHPAFCRMVDTFMQGGLNYFDTAHGYMNGQSEPALRECVVRRYPRGSFVIANKLTEPYFSAQADIRPFFQNQLQWCGVDYFDFYLMHAQDRNIYQKYQRCHAYETALELKAEGKIHHFGISFHDKAEVLDMILTQHPEIDVVQIQFNYVDYDDASVESRKVYDVCVQHGKPVIVMEPVKGGSLVNLPPQADAILRGLGSGSNASYALRFAASFDNMAMVLSGMGAMDQLHDNIATMSPFAPLSAAEMDAVRRVRDIFRAQHLVPCTGCRYCVEQNHCPQGIRIPDMLASLNAQEAFHNWNTAYYYNKVLIDDVHGKASQCIGCGRCERVCPQHLPIRQLLRQAADTFEKKEE